MTRKETIIILLLAAINFTHIVDFMIIMPLGKTLMRMFNVGPQEFSFVVSAYAISAFVSSFGAAFFVDRFDRKKVLLFAYLGFTIGTFLCGIAPTYTMLLAARIVAGFFGGLIGAQVMSIVADLLPIERRGQGMGYLMAAFSVASVVGVPLGITLASGYSWHLPFTALAGLAAIIWLLVFIYLPSVTGHINKDKSPEVGNVYSRIFSDKVQTKALFFSMILMFSHFSVISLMSAYMVSNVGFSEIDVRYIYLLGGAVTIFTAPLIGKVSDKVGKFKVFAFFALFSVIPQLILTQLGHVEMWLALILTTSFFIISGGRIIPSQALISGVVEPKYRGGFMSVNSSFQQLATGSASFVAGLIVFENTVTKELMNYHYVGYLGAVLSVLSVWVGLSLNDRKKNKNAEY